MVSAVTTIVAALRSIEAGEPEALRKSSEALAMALEALSVERFCCERSIL